MNPRPLAHRGEASPQLVRVLLRLAHLPLYTAALLAFFAATLCAAQDIPLGVTYVCSGARLYVENCNIRDTSDTSTCMVGHPDTVLPNGLMKYTYETRGNLKKLLPTCQQPSAKQVAAAKAFQQKQQDIYNANVAKANQQMAAIEQQQAQQDAALSGQPQPSKDPETRAMNRCITSGRLPASCTGNALLGTFTSMIGNVTNQLLGTGTDEDDKPNSGPEMDGVFVGTGNWRIDFVTDGVLVNCASLSPDGHRYKISFRDGNALVTLDTTPRPLVLTAHRDNTITAPGPVTIDGVIASGYDSGLRNSAGQQISASEAAESGRPVFDANGQRTSANVPGHATFSPRRVTCPALNLSTKGATVGIETMQTDVLKTMFGGDKGPPTPPGIRMHGIFAASTGFSVQFFPESAVLGCGPDAARAYPYTVAAEGSNGVININAPDHPLKLVLHSDGSLDPRSTDAYQVHGRFIAGQNDNDDFTFGPLERSCNLALLAPSKTIPPSGGSASTVLASTGADPSTLSTPGHVLGNATLSIASGLPTQPGAPNALAGRPYVLLRDSYATALTKGGVTVPAGMSPYKYVGIACATNTPDCPKIIAAIKASAASAARADATGRATLPALPPGTYYLMISTRYNNQALVWDHPVQLNPGPNTLTLDTTNATLIQ